MIHEKIIIADFGGQYNQLIARRVRDMGVYSEVVPYNKTLAKIKEERPIGIIFTGGPNSVYEENSPKIEKEIFDLGIPILGLCYGMQLISESLGGEVKKTDNREFGKTIAKKTANSPILKDIDAETQVWMSHQDSVSEMPEGFIAFQNTDTCKYAGIQDMDRKIYAVQYHPEVDHTVHGKTLIYNFLKEICHASFDWQMSDIYEEMIKEVREKVKDKSVLLALSGGVDSSVLCAVLEKAIGNKLTAVFVDTGLMRKNEGDEVEEAFRGKSLNFIRVNAKDKYLEALKGITEPEKKRKTIGELFIRVFEEEAKKIGKVDFLAQGTIYPDVIESGLGDAKVIKSHHNVGGLPGVIDFKEIIEPLRNLFKDEVRSLGEKAGLPEVIVNRQPFPGPGLAIRIIGEITEEKLEILREADWILRSELENSLEELPNQYFAVLTNTQTVGVMGDFRTYDYTLALRAVKTTDFMTADWSKIPYEILGKISSRIVNEVSHINRIVYDITSKPPATIEWE